MNAIMEVKGLSKTFTMHQQNSTRLNVLNDVSFAVLPGECLILHGPSGTGKSTLLRTLYGNYLPTEGSIRIQHQGHVLELVNAEPRLTLAVRRFTIGYVSQFLRAIPRVSCLNVVMEPALSRGIDRAQAQARAVTLLQRLSIPERLWALAPGTFSGGEQQRVNIARSFMVDWPMLLLDEPTASLDDANRQVVLELISEAKVAGTGVIAISHDPHTRDAIADHYIDLNAKETCNVH